MSSLRWRWSVLIGIMVAGQAAVSAAEVPARVHETLNTRFGRGPYFLSWRRFAPGTEHVYLNGLRLWRSRDYLVDDALGMVALLRPVTALDALEIDYEKGDAEPNARASAGSDVRLMDRRSLQLDARYRFGQGDSSGALPVSTVGLGAETRGRQFSLSSQLQLSPGSASTGIGYAMGGELGFGGLKLTASYHRAAAGLKTLEGSGLEAGRDSQLLSIAYSGGERLRAAAEMRREGQVGAERTLQREEIVLQPLKAASLTVSHTDEHGGAVPGQTADRVSLGFRHGATNVTAEQTVESSGSGNAASHTNTQRIALAQSLSRSAATGIVFTARDSGRTSQQRGQIDVAAHLGSALDVKTQAYQQIERKGSAESITTGLAGQVDARVGPLKVGSSVEHEQVTDGERSSVGLDVASLGGALTLRGRYHESSVPSAEDAGYETDFMLKPIRQLTVSAGIQASDSPAAAHSDQHVAVELMPGRSVRIAGHLRAVTSKGSQVDASGVEASLRPFRALELSGTYEQRDGTAVLPLLDTYDAQVALRLIKGVRLIGGYTENPEENGSVLALSRHRIGLETSLGRLLLNGGYALEERAGKGGLQESNWGFGLALSKATRIEATYRRRDGELASADAQQSYGVRFAHQLADRFSLSLEAQQTDRLNATGPVRPAYEGSARLGMRF